MRVTSRSCQTTKVVYQIFCPPIRIHFHFHCRQVREIFFDLHTRRLNKWDGRKKVEPPNEETMPSLETTPTPQEDNGAASVSDLPPPAGLAQGNRVVKPVPVSAITMANPVVESRNVDHNATSGGVSNASGVSVGVRGGELPVEYGSVNLMSQPPQPPQPPPSAFFPAPAQHQQVQIQRTLSLPVQHQGIIMVSLCAYVNVDTLTCTMFHCIQCFISPAHNFTSGL